ncbi:hypothetical protein, partial [Stenotrophomonas maltophilia]|uniref:hypothetical protein n=1 Tax=Stenotrophomonas maltophilia TaxID=40324 RepID=UPI001953BA2D
YLMTFGLILVFHGLNGLPYGANVKLETFKTFLVAMPFVTAGTLAWVFIGYRFNVALIGAVSGATGVT